LAAPLAFTYAILRHRLFGIGYIVRRGLQYALARRGLISIVPSLLAIFGIDLWIHRTVPVADILSARGYVYVALAALAGVAWSQRDRWLEKLDRRFFRERYAAERLLRDVSASVRVAGSIEAAASQVAREIDAALHPQGLAILARTTQDP